MNTVIVPVDFSENSYSAARYAVKLLTAHPEVEIILYHTYNKADAEENAIENLEKFKTELCNNFEIYGHCKYGKNCNYAHGDHELKKVKHYEKYKTIDCENFHNKWYCSYGSRCKFKHI